jgi:hypothetical protein
MRLIPRTGGNLMKDDPKPPVMHGQAFAPTSGWGIEPDRALGQVILSNMFYKKNELFFYIR